MNDGRVTPEEEEYEEEEEEEEGENEVRNNIRLEMVGKFYELVILVNPNISVPG